jgi:NTP pyrophosphatase (non-canonical NTP hydrolase)
VWRDIKGAPTNGCPVARVGSLLLSEYAQQVIGTDVLDENLIPILQGLIGEVGGVMSTAKKVVREREAFVGHRRAAADEFGDVLWYFAALCRRLETPLETVFCEAVESDGYKLIGAASDVVGGALVKVVQKSNPEHVDAALFRLARAATALSPQGPTRAELLSFAAAYIDALDTTDLTFSEVARGNLDKARGAFISPEPLGLIDFDEKYQVEEQLPRAFEIRVNQRESGRSYLRWNGVFIGDPLTDNIADPDGYRFHDVFHFAHAAILHWSPVMRALIRHKRKSRPDVDEAQDGGRAIVVEEGLTAWIFARAKELDFFAGQSRVSLGILKTIGEFVAGYEVSQVPLKLWERAILDGYAAFRELRDHEGGWIVGDRGARTIRFEPLEWKE